jgi:cytochrome b subunit of formate dehydrogenase
MTTNAISRPRLAHEGEDEKTIIRYTFGERVNHWFGALTYTYLLITGLAFWSPYL